MIFWGSGPPSPFPLLPEKAICCDAVSQQIQHETGVPWYLQLYRGMASPAPGEPEGRSSSWVTRDGGERQVHLRKKVGWISTVFKTACSHSFLHAGLLSCMVFVLLRGVGAVVNSDGKAWNSRYDYFFLRSPHPPDPLPPSGKETFCLVTSANTSSFSSWVQWAILGWNLKLSGTSTAAAASIGDKSKVDSSEELVSAADRSVLGMYS